MRSVRLFMKLVSPLEYLASLLVKLHMVDNSEYSARDYASLVLFAAKSMDYAETVSKVMKSLPNVDTLFASLKPRNTLGNIERFAAMPFLPCVELLLEGLSSPQKLEDGLPSSEGNATAFHLISVLGKIGGKAYEYEVLFVLQRK